MTRLRPGVRVHVDGLNETAVLLDVVQGMHEPQAQLTLAHGEYWQCPARMVHSVEPANIADFDPVPARGADTYPRVPSAGGLRLTRRGETALAWAFMPVIIGLCFGAAWLTTLWGVA